MSLINLWRTKNKAKKKVIKRKYGLPSSQLTLRYTAALWCLPIITYGSPHSICPRVICHATSRLGQAVNRGSSAPPCWLHSQT